MKYYKVVLSNRQEIALDEQDYKKLLQGMDSGSFVRLKKAIINPSYIMAILPIKQSEALGEEIPQRIKGHVDEEKGVYVVDQEKIVPAGIKDEFK